MSSQRRRFDELVRAVCDQSATEAMAAEFNELLRGQPDWQDELVEHLGVQSLLSWQSADVTIEAAAAEATAAAWETQPHRFRRGGIAALAAIAAAVLAAIGLSSQPGNGGRAAGGGPVARLIDVRDVVWNALAAGQTTPGPIQAGRRLQSKGGSYRLEFDNGATVRIEGPAEVEVASSLLVRMQRGQATIRITEASQGFTLETPQVDVVDQGTSFGVQINDDGQTDVIVFEGEVDVLPTSRGATRRLVRGEAIRFAAAAGEMTRLEQVGLGPQGKWWSSGPPPGARHAIAEVRDNIPPSDGSRYFCYQLTHGSFGEDVFAYADHPHEWNSAVRTGMPLFLRDADYVKTFNDYRYLNDFQMTVALSGPATLYVFFDDRVPTPYWLKSQFEDTGVDVGLDEGSHAETQGHRTDTGPGRSIDERFSVWRRVCRDGGEVKLGPVGPSAEARAMYGIAAARLD